MNILFLVPYVPNLIRVRPYNLIRQLSARGHQVTVLTLVSNDKEQAEANELRCWCPRVETVYLRRMRSGWNCLLAMPSRTPLQAVYCWHPALMAKLAELAGSADIVHVEHLRGVRYAVQLKRIRPQCPVVWDSVDCISLLFRQAARRSKKLFNRWVTRFELERTERYEGWLLTQFDRVLVTSPADQAALADLRRASEERSQPPIGVLANGVDLDYFKPGPEAVRARATLVISGKMSYHANVTMVLHFVKEVLPLIEKQRPDVRLCIVGKEPPREIVALAQNPAITVTGTVSDVRPYLQGATLAIAPIQYGVGIQNKVLEAMACATPTVASPQAVSALQRPLDGALEVATSDEAFAQGVVDLLADASRRRQIGLGGRRYVETYHRWESIVSKLEGVYHEVLCTKH